MGRKGREYILERFSRARMAEKYIDVLHAITAKPEA
jgi:hypothetical protein